MKKKQSIRIAEREMPTKEEVYKYEMQFPIYLTIRKQVLYAIMYSRI